MLSKKKQLFDIALNSAENEIVDNVCCSLPQANSNDVHELFEFVTSFHGGFEYLFLKKDGSMLAFPMDLSGNNDIVKMIGKIKTLDFLELCDCVALNAENVTKEEALYEFFYTRRQSITNDIISNLADFYANPQNYCYEMKADY